MEPLTSDDPREIAGYHLRARLGTGGMGRVYLAYTPGGRAVAVKVMRPELGDDRDFRDRFRREVEAAERVHGLYTAQVIDADPGAVPPWIVTAYVPGPSLRQAIAEHGPVPIQTVYQLTAGVAEALQVIHSAGLVHRDLKPSNVLLAPDGPRVIDFGIARAADATALTGAGTRIGSAPFMAPEQAEGSPATPATDVFALGSLVAYAALGRAPFGDAGEEAVLYRIVHQNPDLEGCPEPLRSLIDRCLAKDPAQRPQLGEIIRFCQAALGGDATRIGESWPGVAQEPFHRNTFVATLPGAVAPDGESRATPPSSIVNAVRLMYAGAVSAVLNAIVGSAAVFRVVHEVFRGTRGVNQNTVTTVTALDVTVTIFFGLAGTALWLWMARANREGRSWARILSTILFATLTLTLPLTFIQIPYLPVWITALLQWALALSALVLLWLKPSGAYFAAMRGPAATRARQTAT